MMATKGAPVTLKCSMSKLRFNVSDHTYWIGKKQQVGVSTIIDRLKTGKAYYTDNSQSRGTNVHLATRYADEGRDVSEVGFRGYLRAWERFKRDNEFIVMAIERPLYHPTLGYAGTLDRYGLYRGEVPTVVDIKSGVRQNWHAVQTGGYTELAKVEWEQDYVRGIVVYLGKTGSYRMVRSKVVDRNVFLACLTVLRWEEKNG